MRTQKQTANNVLGGRMTKVNGQVASFAPAMAFAVSAVALGATGALAQTVIDGPMASSYGLEFDESVTIDPFGSILVDSGETFAIGYDGDGETNDFDGSVSNDGAIGLLSYDDDGAAVEISSASLGGQILNSGLIATEVIGSSSYSSYDAAGIFVDEDVLLGALISNDGEISVDVDVYSGEVSGSAAGIFVGGDLFGTVANDGEIAVTVEAEGYSSYSAASGIYVGGDVEGDLDVAGEIVVDATTDGDWYSWANAIGVYVDSDVTGEFNSSGSITVLKQGDPQNNQNTGQLSNR